MDDEHTALYREPCTQCSAVDWGVSDEGRFYCRSCHNVIERTKEVVETTYIPGSTRVSTISRGARTKRREGGRRWAVCEAFQFILRNQANALLRLGVSPHFKDDVLCRLWRLYLNKSGQAYTDNPVRSSRFQLGNLDLDSDSGSVAKSSVTSASAAHGEADLWSGAGSQAESCSDWSQCSGSVDTACSLTPRPRRRSVLMSMTKTLALIHLALVWSLEPLTLSDLLRLVYEGHVPYVNAYEELPDEMNLGGRDGLVFRVESVPSHRVVHSEAQSLLLLLQLPAFPPVGRQTLLHPALLTLRYLTDANLPDELHPWVCRLMERAAMADEALHTVGAASCPVLPRYDVQAAALIMVTMKVVFGLDDHTEWDLSNRVSDLDDSGNTFSLRRWFRLMQAALSRAQHRRDQDAARKQWKAKKPLYPNNREKYVVMKKKRTAEQVQTCFEKLSSRPAGVRPTAPSSFTFCWGDEDGADGPSLHHMQLGGLVTRKRAFQTPTNCAYWHPALRRCDPRTCGSHYPQVEPTLPRSFVWLLRLFSFLLGVTPAYLHEEVLRVERRVFGRVTPRDGRGRRRTPRGRRRTCRH